MINKQLHSKDVFFLKPMISLSLVLFNLPIELDETTCVWQCHLFSHLIGIILGSGVWVAWIYKSGDFWDPVHVCEACEKYTKGQAKHY